MKGILVAAILDKITTLKDKSVKIVFDTQELNPATAGQLFTLLNSLASLYISPAEITGSEMKQVDLIEPDMPGKTPSQRMRDVLFVSYKQDNEGFREFDSFYKSRMENYINEIKNNLLP